MADDRSNGTYLQICAFFGLVHRNKAELENMAPVGTVDPADKSEEDKKAERAEQPYKALETYFLLEVPLQERLSYEWAAGVSKDLQKHGAVTTEQKFAKVGYQTSMRTQRHEVSEKMYYETQEAAEDKGVGRFASVTQKIMDIYLVILGLQAVEIKEDDAPLGGGTWLTASKLEPGKKTRLKATLPKMLALARATQRAVGQHPLYMADAQFNKIFIKYMTMLKKRTLHSDCIVDWMLEHGAPRYAG